MATDPAPTGSPWDEIAGSYTDAMAWSNEIVHYGPDVPNESEMRLLGDVNGKRVLDLGCGGGANAIALARHGARVIGVDRSRAMLNVARSACTMEDVRVELRQGDLAELAFLGPGSIDLVLSVDALGEVPDLARVFRQVHRVLRPEAPLVFSLPHPAWAPLAGSTQSTGPGGPAGAKKDADLQVCRAYWDRSPVAWEWEGVPVTLYPHTFADVFTALFRANFRVDTVVEPEPSSRGHRSPRWTEAARWMPRMLIVRARKQGL